MRLNPANSETSETPEASLDLRRRQRFEALIQASTPVQTVSLPQTEPAKDGLPLRQPPGMARAR